MTQAERLARIVELEQQIGILTNELRRLEIDERDHDSKEYIRVNKITRDSVFSAAECKDWIGVFDLVGPYMSTHGISKRYVEWNGKLHHAYDAMLGMRSETPAYYEHVPEVNT